MDFSCCEKDETDNAETKLPMECFEDFGCPGLFWLGPSACSHDIINSIHMVQETTHKIETSNDYSLRTDEDVKNTNSEQSIEGRKGWNLYSTMYLIVAFEPKEITVNNVGIISFSTNSFVDF